MNEQVGTTKTIKSTRFSPLVFAILSLIGVFILYQGMGGGIAFLIFGSRVTQENLAVVRFTTMVSQFIFLLIPTLLLIKWQHGSLRAALPLRIPKMSEIILTVVSVMALQQVLEGYIFFQDKIPLPSSIAPYVEMMKKSIEETYKLLVETHSVLELLYIIIIVSVTPALCEEVLFRGLIQKNILLGSNVTLSWIVTGVIFALYHVNPFLVVPLMLIGMFFSFLLHRSQTIILPMIAHFTNNVISAMQAFTWHDEPSRGSLSIFEQASTPMPLVLILIVGFGLVFAISFIMYLKTTSSLTNVSRVTNAM